MEVDRHDLREIQRIMRALSKEAPERFKEAGRKAAEVIATEARRRVPRLTGRLAGSIRTGAVRGGGWVAAGSSSVPYAFVHEFGWPRRNIPAKEFIYGSIREKGDEALEEYTKVIDDILGIGGIL